MYPLASGRNIPALKIGDIHIHALGLERIEDELTKKFQKGSVKGMYCEHCFLYQ